MEFSIRCNYKINISEYTAVSGQDIINFLKTNFEKKNEKEIIEFA